MTIKDREVIIELVNALARAEGVLRGVVRRINLPSDFTDPILKRCDEFEAIGETALDYVKGEI